MNKQESNTKFVVENARYVKIKKEIEKILLNSPLDFELKHSELVLKWLLKLKPDSDESLRIAALAHDIERGVTKITEKGLKDYSKINEFKKEHAIRSAKIICHILKKYNYPSKLIEKVRYLVENHESGIDKESNILMDADSIAYFDYNIPSYLKRNGKEKAKGKIKFMYKRLSDKAKKLVNKIKFEDKEIESLFKEALSEIST